MAGVDFARVSLHAFGHEAFEIGGDGSVFGLADAINRAADVKRSFMSISFDRKCGGCRGANKVARAIFRSGD